MELLLLLALYACLSPVKSDETRYKPEWSDLDMRPLPEWYDRGKIGIFIHWGVFSVPSYGSEWFWFNWNYGKDGIREFMLKNYRPGFTYQEFASQFTAEFFDAKEWAEIFAKSGARYVVLTTKHHEGFTLFPSRKSFGWNSVDIGPHRDIVAELSDAVRSVNIKFGVYHSLYEWFNPIYLEDKKNLFRTKVYTESKLWPDIKQLIEDYKPSVLWADGDWEAPDTYWNSTDLIAWLYNDSPVKDEIVVNDRWGIGIPCKHGDFYNCADRYNPGVLKEHKWENCFTLDKDSWGYRRNMKLKNVMTFEAMLKEIITTVSCGGNVLINVGPTKEGTIVPIFQLRLRQLGIWLQTNGEAIYDTSPWLHQNDSLTQTVWYTCRKRSYNGLHPTEPPSVKDDVTAIYAITLAWPANNTLTLRDLTSFLPDKRSRITLLGARDYLKWEKKQSDTVIHFPRGPPLMSRQAFALKIVPFL